MSIVYGYYQADGGEIEVDGRPAGIRSPEQAIAARHRHGSTRHFMLVDTFTILENVVLGVETGGLMATSFAHARGELERLERDYSLEVDADAIVGEIPVGIQQRVEILKALYRGADILILDEPTGVLTPQEVEHLFRILRALRDQGKTVILITHKLREIMALTDKVTVMRQGRVVANVETAATSREELASMMVGRTVLLRVEKTAAHPGETFLEVEGLSVVDGSGVQRLKDVSFAVRAGEIVGIAGVAGNGQSELLEALAGIRAPSAGRIRVKGISAVGEGKVGTPKSMRELGLGHVPEDRQHVGLIVSFEASESGILGYHRDRRYNRAVIMDRGAVIADVDRVLHDYDVRPAAVRLRTSSFSGGNQQKIVLGARARPRSRRALGRPAHARRRHRRHRIHPQTAHRHARFRQGDRAGFGRARRDHVALGSYPGHVRGRDHRRGGAGPGHRADARPDDGGRAPGRGRPGRRMSEATLAPAQTPRWVTHAVVPGVNLLVALILSGLLIALIGEDPFQALIFLVRGAFGNTEFIGYTLYFATNFIFTGLAVAIAFHCGLFNIGGEGQAYIGRAGRRDGGARDRRVAGADRDRAGDLRRRAVSAALGPSFPAICRPSVAATSSSRRSCSTSSPPR